jgi:hypothetical protein
MRAFRLQQKAPGYSQGLGWTDSPETYALKEDPQPQVLFTFGFSNLKPAASRVST